MGGAIPDPLTMGVNQKKIDKYSTDLKTMTGKFFSYTGDSWNPAGGLANYSPRSLDRRSVFQ